MDGGQILAGSRRLERPRLNSGPAYGLTFLAVCLWGFSPIGTRFLVGLGQSGLPPLAVNGVRYGLSALAFVPLLWQARGWRAADWRLAAICGFLGVAGYNIPATLGQLTVSAGLTGLLDGAEPLLIVIFSAVLARRFPGRRTMFATGLALCGVLLLAQGSGPKLGTPLGVALVLAGAALWAAYCVLVPPLINRHGALPATAAVLLFGAIPLVVTGLPATPAMLHAMNGFDWLVMAGLVAACSVAATLCWNFGSAALGAERAGWFLYMVPLVSLTGGAVLLHEPLKLAEIFGGGLILVGVYLSQR